MLHRMKPLEPELVEAVAAGARRIELCAYTHLGSNRGDTDKERATMRRALEGAIKASGREPAEYRLMPTICSMFVAGDAAFIGEFVKQPGFEKMSLNGGILMTYDKDGGIADVGVTTGIEQ